MQQRVYVIIADLSGYTQLLASSELAQSRAVVNSITSVLLEQTAPPLVISAVQGDAILMYAPEERFLRGQTLLEMLENMYCVFRRALEQEHYSTTCSCNACSLRPTLDLKIIVHVGEAIVEHDGARPVLHGPEVIVAHRLLKNSITLNSGIRAYAFFSEAAAHAMALDPALEGLAPHVETYEHLGEVRGYVYDLHAVWARASQGSRIVVGAGDDCWFEHEVELPAPPAVVWDYLHSPEKKQAWLQLDATEVLGLRRGRMGAGTEQACVQGREPWRLRVVDWRPFDYVTAEYLLPLGAAYRITLALAPTSTGTRVTARAARPDAPRRLQTLLARALLGLVREGIEQNWRRGLWKLREAIESDLPSDRPSACDYSCPGDAGARSIAGG
jgi:uncharacterized protein YndB with AHSA1/START domain